MSIPDTSEALLFGRRDLDAARLLGGLRQLVRGGEYALEWRPGCPAGESAAVTVTWRELEGAGSWVMSQRIRDARKVAFRMSEILECPLDYVEGKFETDREYEASSANASLFECQGRKLVSKGLRDAELHDGNSVAIALEGAGLFGLRTLRSGRAHLYPVTGVATEPASSAGEPVTELRPNLTGLWDWLASGKSTLRCIGPNEYVLEVAKNICYVDTSEVEYIAKEIERRGLLPWNPPDFELPER